MARRRRSKAYRLLPAEHAAEYKAMLADKARYPLKFIAAWLAGKGVAVSYTVVHWDRACVSQGGELTGGDHTEIASQNTEAERRDRNGWQWKGVRTSNVQRMIARCNAGLPACREAIAGDADGRLELERRAGDVLVALQGGVECVVAAIEGALSGAFAASRLMALHPSDSPLATAERLPMPAWPTAPLEAQPSAGPGPCVVPGCQRRARARGLCSSHYAQAYNARQQRALDGEDGERGALHPLIVATVRGWHDARTPDARRAVRQQAINLVLSTALIAGHVFVPLAPILRSERSNERGGDGEA